MNGLLLRLNNRLLRKLHLSAKYRVEPSRFFALIQKFPKKLNRRFLRLFIKNAILVFSGIAVLLTATTFIIYAFANRQLVQEVDAANRRGVEIALTTVDAVVMASREATARFALDRAVYRLMVSPAPVMPNFDNIQPAIEMLRNMRLSQRHLLDYSIFLYLSGSGYSLCTVRGGQFANYHPDQDIVKRFAELRTNNPSILSFTVFRQANFSIPSSERINVLTFYHQIIGAVPGAGFVALNVDVNALASYLRGLDPNDGSRFIMIDSSGRIILDTDGLMAGSDISLLVSRDNDIKSIHNSNEGSITVETDSGAMRLSWRAFPIENWTIMQFIPLEAYMSNMYLLRNFIFSAVALSLLFSALIALLVTMRLFRPVSDIIRIVESPDTYNFMRDQSGEINLLLMSVLESFQKNIVLEKEMIQKVAALRDSRTIALQKQISPHFLYNTLQIINWLVVAETKQEDSGASQAVIALAEIVRDSMDYSSNFNTIANEVAHVKKYMKIIQLSFGEEISMQLNVTPGIEQFKILRVILQPLVENAIQHGILPDGEKGIVYVDISAEAGMLFIIVEDDGAGISDTDLKEYNQKLQSEDMYVNSNIGLLNICQRIKLIYGEEYGIVLGKSDYGGLKVDIKMPLSNGLTSPGVEYKW